MCGGWDREFSVFKMQILLGEEGENLKRVACEGRSRRYPSG